MFPKVRGLSAAPQSTVSANLGRSMVAQQAHPFPNFPCGHPVDVVEGQVCYCGGDGIEENDAILVFRNKGLPGRYFRIVDIDSLAC